ILVFIGWYPNNPVLFYTQLLEIKLPITMCDYIDSVVTDYLCILYQMHDHLVVNLYSHTIILKALLSHTK
ncbi:MAG: hypothetical protein ACJ71G_18895, partial [Nitrososphaeraceae archaeon]